MTNGIAYIGSLVTGLNAVVNGKSYTIAADNPHLKAIFEVLAAQPVIDEVKLVRMLDTASAIRAFMKDKVEISGGELRYGGRVIHNVVVDRILAFMDEGFAVTPLVNFLERLLQSPSQHSVEELYPFMEQNKLPITDDGFVLGYKGVNMDYTDKYTGKIDNSPGSIPPRFERNQVDDDWRHECSSGYHIGSLAYARSFGARVVIVKFDPADVVAVPDASWKLRAVGYEVLGDENGVLPPLYSRSNAYEMID